MKLAPPPDFRYVGLAPAGPDGFPWWKSLAGASAVASVGVLPSVGFRDMVLAAGVTSLSVILVRWLGRLKKSATRKEARMAIVPWGVILEPDEGAPRVFHWAGIQRIAVETRHGKDQGTPTTLFSTVVLETETDAWAGRAPGSVPLDRLLAYLDDYAVEQSKPVALDLDGRLPSDGPTEPEVELLLTSARGYLDTGPASERLSLPPGTYRLANTHAASPETVSELRRVLTCREVDDADPRAFAAVVAAELGVVELVDALLELIQCPHPVVAAVAKQAARKLGAVHGKTGTLDEVAPFLRSTDVETLAAWAP